MLKLQEVLLSGNDPEDLKRELFINCKVHNKFPNLHLFKYGIDSPMGNPIVQESRGIVLDRDDNWKVVCHSFNKFFNHGEGHAASIDWNTAKVQEKLDGSLIQIYYYDNNWQVASSGTPDASGQVNTLFGGSWEPRPGMTKATPGSFAEYFWQVAELDSDIFKTLKDHTNYCFYFELMGSLNRIVVKHEQSHVKLLGARNLVDGKEIPVQQAHELLGGKFPHVQEFSLTSFDDVLETFQTMSPLSQEGYVIVDSRFNRVKVKHPGYVALHHAKDGMGTKAFVEIVRSGEVSEVLTAFPEFKPSIDECKQRFDKFVLELEEEYEKIKDIIEQKEFALKAVKTKCSSALFLLRAKKIDSIRQHLANINIDHLVGYLGYK